MKRKYEKPMAYEERFAADNYCTSACYYIACQVGPSKQNGPYGYKWNGNERGDVSHSAAGASGTCADSSANRVITNSGLESATKVGEYNKDQNWITGGIDHWEDVNGDGKVNTGDVIYWHTESAADASGYRWGRWNHWGTVGGVDSKHPNLS